MLLGLTLFAMTIAVTRFRAYARLEEGTLLQTAHQSGKARSWWWPRAADRAGGFAEFHQAFVRGIMETERLRMKTLIAMSAVVAVCITYRCDLLSEFIERIWKAHSTSGTSTRSSFRSPLRGSPSLSYRTR